jgi:hypothetical protein
MKMGTTLSPCPYDAAACYALQSANLRRPAILRLNGSFKPTMKRFADLDGPDFFPTPRWATFALIENEKFDGEIWECACGNGTMSRVLEETGQPVRSTDLYDRGFGKSGVDFLTSRSEADNIVTNPPYNCA